jgi:signal transduction histidine kinase
MLEGVNHESCDLERQCAQLAQQLQQSQRMVALGELVSTTTHEFNNVLMTIINYAKLGMRHKDQSTRDRAFEKILAASNRAAKITNGVLGIARQRAESFTPVDLSKLIEDALVLMEREMNKYRVTVETRFDAAPEAMCRPSQIQQVLLNLLTNARQALPGGGRIVIRGTPDAENNAVDLVVRDNGKGIPADVLPRIFDRFFSTKSGPDATGKGGAGLGLAACREIVEEHHGRIRVESTVGKGTSFTIKLPAAPKSTPKPNARPASAPIIPLVELESPLTDGLLGLPG